MRGLPRRCRRCCRAGVRASFMPAMAAADVHGAARERRLGRLVFDLHNGVNRKLNRPSFDRYAIVVRQSQVWPVEFTERGVRGALRGVLNYAANKEPLKPTTRASCTPPSSCVGPRPAAGRGGAGARPEHRARPSDMFDRLHRAYERYRTSIAKTDLIRRYELCRSTQ